MWWMHDWGAGWWLWVLMPVSMLVFWGLVIWAVVALVRGSDQNAGSARTGTGPERVLGERYARGEIDQDEYEQRLATLRGTTRNAA